MSAMKRKVWTTPKDLILFNSTVIDIEKENEIVGDKIKNVFYVKDEKNNKILCILWRMCFVNVGDEVLLKGRYDKNGAFLVWNLMILKKAEKSENESLSNKERIQQNLSG